MSIMTRKQLIKIVRKLADSSFKKGKIKEGKVVKAIRILKSLPQHEVTLALGEYLNSLKRMERQYTMVVETSIPLPSTTVKKMKKIVEKKHEITKVVVNINPEILGGFKLKIGDEIYDESILAKINQVKEAIVSGRPNSTN